MFTELLQPDGKPVMVQLKYVQSFRPDGLTGSTIILDSGAQIVVSEKYADVAKLVNTVSFQTPTTGLDMFSAKFKEGAADIKGPENISELRLEYYKAGARAVLNLVNKSITDVRKELS